MDESIYGYGTNYEKVMGDIIDHITWTGVLSFGPNCELLLDGEPLYPKIYNMLRFGTGKLPMKISIITQRINSEEFQEWIASGHHV